MFKTYIDENDEETDFVVFLIHGHDTQWKDVEKYIKKILNYNVFVLKKTFSGKVMNNKFRDAIYDDCDCAVAIFSPDDTLIDGSANPRQNVLYELGYCHGFFDRHYEDDDIVPVIILKENSVTLSSDLAGIECLEYEKGNIHSTFPLLAKGLNNLFEYMCED